jgi:hypothetical protein
LNLNGNGYATNPFGGNSAAYSEKAIALARKMNAAWINFIADGNPNGSGAFEWPVYDHIAGGGVGHGVVFDIDSIYSEVDDWRAEGMNWMATNALTVFGN